MSIILRYHRAHCALSRHCGLALAYVLLSLSMLSQANAADALAAGTMTLRREANPAATCNLKLYDIDLPYDHEGVIPLACYIKIPSYIRFNTAPSAVTIMFVKTVNNRNRCWPGTTGYKFRIDMKTTQNNATTPELYLNDILQSARAPDDGPGDGVVVPGLRTVSVYRSAEVGNGYNYIDNMSCIIIQRSKD